MAGKDQDIKKNLVEALKTLGVDISQELQEEKSKKEDEYEDFTEMAYKTKEKIDELNTKGEEMLKKTGMTKEQLEVYGSNPKNFTKEQWEALQKIKEVAEEYKNLSSEGMEHILNANMEETKEKEKKGPSKFAKKKDWIPL